MKVLISAITLCLVAIIVGCGSTTGNETNRIFPSEFPSFAIDRPINDPIEVVIPIGNGSMEETVRIEMVDGVKKKVSRVKTTTDWDIAFNQEQITTTLNTRTELSTPDIEGLDYEFQEELISDAEGKKISYLADFKGIDSELPSEMIDEFNELQPKWITAKYHLDKAGMLVKSGDQMQPSAIKRYLLRDVIGDEIHSKIEIPEIVEGYGKYDNKLVIVTSYSIDKTFDDEGSTVQIKGKGFNLYDAESNIQVLGKFHMLLNVSDEDKKVVQMTTQINQRSTGYNVSGVIRGK
jgi:hypothetical protein